MKEQKKINERLFWKALIVMIIYTLAMYFLAEVGNSGRISESIILVVGYTIMSFVASIAIHMCIEEYIYLREFFKQRNLLNT